MTGGDALGRSYRANGHPHYTAAIGGSDPEYGDRRLCLGPFGAFRPAMTAGMAAARQGERVAVMCVDSDKDEDWISVAGEERKA